MRLLVEAAFGIGAGFFLAAVAFGVLDPTIVAGLGVVALVVLISGRI